jgi:hypothetical protein
MDALAYRSASSASVSDVGARKSKIGINGDRFSFVDFAREIVDSSSCEALMS